jgi:lipopolysaccharide transport system permease protein
VQTTASAAPVAYLQDVWQLRYFWRALVWADLKNRYKRSVLGIGWSLVHPIAMTTVLCYAFHTIFGIVLSDYVPFLMTGMAYWAFVSSTATEGCQAFYQAQGFIRSEKLPLAIFPLRVVVGTTMHLGITLLLSLACTLCFKGSLNVLPLVSLVPTILLLFAFGWALATLTSFGCVHFPDTQHLSTILLQILFYLTPVMYPPSILEKKGIGDVLKWNPLGSFVELIRAPLVDGTFPTLKAYVIAGGCTLFLVALAAWLLRRCERHLIFALI